MDPMDCPVCPTRDIPPGQDLCPGCGTDLTPLWRIRGVREGGAVGVASLPRTWGLRPGPLAAVAAGLVVIPFFLGIVLGRGASEPAADSMEGSSGHEPMPAMGASESAPAMGASEPAPDPSPDTPGPELAPILALFDGVPEVAAAREGARVRLVFREGLFASASDLPHQAGRSALKEVAAALGRMARDSGRGVMVEVVGHCDPLPPRPGGPWEDNWCLAFDRAHAAVEILRGEAPGDPIFWTASAQGATDPPYPNDIEAGRARNRTVVLFVAPTLPAP